jgi:rhamnose utilization protein RhaD (predicted bifunctional aldolase and dehydrogenase)/NAD(P)-dependent dehydrogenase (short-subunit alcohol dehydrogenase family)
MHPANNDSEIIMTEWPTFSSTDSLLDQLVKLSRYYGADSEMVIGGGGNTSVKHNGSLWVKGSGFALADIPAEGFVELDRQRLQKILEMPTPPDRQSREEAFKHETLAARVRPEKSQRPSVEAVLHHLMPGQFVVHTHSTLVNMFTCCVNGEALIRETLGDAIIWIPGVDPGLILAQTLQQALDTYRRQTQRQCPRAVIMQNHGLVVCGDTPEQVKADTDWVLSRLRDRLAREPASAPFGAAAPRDAAEVRRQINIIAPALRGLLCVKPEQASASPTGADAMKIVTFDDSETVLQLVCGDHGQRIASGGPLCPDQIVYCKSFPLWFVPQAGESPKDTVARLRTAIHEHTKTHRLPPHVVLVQSIGLFAAGDDYAQASTVRLVYIDAIKVMAGATRLGGIRYLSPEFREFIENWEVESYRRQVGARAGSSGRAAGKIAIVTGAAQGFGLEISQQFAAAGGTVVLTDMNADGAKRAADELSRSQGNGRALGLPVNVTDSASVDEMVHQVVRSYGGFDVFIANAGVLKAGSVKTLSEKDFDFVTSVNYRGFFICTQKAVHVLATQHLAREDYWSDIIQINSKSGLRGSNKNGAYAGGKFGGIGLVESFAMELVEDGIKVNAICPGNFYDGPLWSDPKNGLFVQYLSAGKVPGAKTIADVRRYYESLSPIHRGCTTPDVMKAVYYLMDQQYETGQALPVTGGQVMLK